MSNDQLDQHALAAGRAFPWHELYVPDVAAAVDFYSKVFDMGSDTMPMGDGAPYTMLSVNGVSIAGVMSTNSPEMPNVPPHWAIYMTVDDVDARLAKVTENGGTVVVPPMDIPNVGRMALIADPQGAHIWLYKHSM
ncbi:MAG: VOC family protein [Armatimonadetes bacterium]|nr:VOC family protein [Armatimonadota bacterium]NOG92038.1 VOC family protein [Armatimonadota bacterium]